MSFLAPWYVPLVAGAAVIPPLVLLYFLKLKRRQVPIASTLLWRRAVEDLHVNAPFQKLRSSLLLILQLLILLLAILAIAEPMLAGADRVEQAIVLLVDRSASMATREEDGQSRLDIARDEALRLIDEMSTEHRAMVISFADRAHLLTPFTDDKEMLRQAVRLIEQSDLPGQLSEALKLAEAHSTPIGEDIGVGADVPYARFVLLTDGRLPDAGKVAVQRGRMDLLRVGRATENVGIVDVDVRRHYEQPEQLSVLARVRNFGSQTVSRDLSLFVDGALKDVRPIEGLAPLGDEAKLGTLVQPGMAGEGNEATATFEMVLDTGADIELRLSGQDAFPVDDRAYALAVAPRSMTVLLVTPGNRYLRDLVAAMPLSHYDIWSPDEYEKAPDAQLLDAGRCKYDVVIIDGHSTERLPPGNYIFFGGLPIIDGVEAGDWLRDEVILDWDATHPILRRVAIEGVHVFSWLDLKLPRQARVLVEATNGPVMALLTPERRQILLCAFSFFDESRQMLNTDWVFDESLVVFIYNSLRYLSGSTTESQQKSTRPGEPLTLAVAPGRTSVSVHRPDGEDEEVGVVTSGLVTYGRTDRVGVYKLDTGVAGEQARAVNLLDEDESFIAPNRDFHIAAGDVQAGEASELRHRPLWPYVLMALGVVLMFEWFIYNKRVFI